MIVATCPHCESRFRLPEDRIGPGGARVRCDRCEGAFDWILSPVVDEVAGDVRDVFAGDFFMGLEPESTPMPVRPRDHEANPAPASANAASAVDEIETKDATPETVARLAVEELVNAGAEALVEAYDRGVLFSSFGPEVLGAWQRCRDRLGSSANPAAFRAALSARLGVDLPGWRDRR
jgi:predicted Zn finger-like uncharacterized protein